MCCTIDNYCSTLLFDYIIINTDQVFFLFTIRQQIDKYRREGEDLKNRLYEYETDAQRMQQETALENEKVAKQ